MKAVFPLAALLLGACGSGPRTTPAPAPVFDPIRFFTGSLDGQGTLKVLIRHAQQVHVLSRGRVEPDGTLILDQRVEAAGEQPRDRQWRLHKVAPGHFTGTLSDATGPVDATVTGNRLHLRFAMKGGMQAQQWIDLSPDGRVGDNMMVVRKLDMTVARLHEIIRKTD